MLASDGLSSLSDDSVISLAFGHWHYRFRVCECSRQGRLYDRFQTLSYCSLRLMSIQSSNVQRHSKSTRPISRLSVAAKSTTADSSDHNKINKNSKHHNISYKRSANSSSNTSISNNISNTTTIVATTAMPLSTTPATKRTITAAAAMSADLSQPKNVDLRQISSSPRTVLMVFLEVFIARLFFVACLFSCLLTVASDVFLG